MTERNKAVVRFKSGKILKGFLDDFSPGIEEVILEETGTSRNLSVKMDELKAVFFVKSFEGDSEYRETKSYGVTSSGGKKLFVKFKDGESLVGFLEGDFPWQRGFFLSKRDKVSNGFYLSPVDADSNNIRVFVVASSVDDITVMPRIAGGGAGSV